VVVTHALHCGDQQTARRVAELAHHAAPDELTPRVDMAAAAGDGTQLVHEDDSEDIPERLLRLCAQTGQTA
jgi:hypothetical protein